MSALRRGWRAVSGFVADLMGDSGYDRYLARHRLEHPGHEPLDARSWWRLRAEAAERQVHHGCC